MIAFAKAAQNGIKWVEFDVTLTADEVPIIIHDDTLERTTNGRGRVDQFKHSYLQTLDAGSWFNPRFANERIPDLLSALNFLKAMQVSANIELKSTQRAESLVMRVLEVVKRVGYRESLFSSFSIPALSLLRKHAPHARIGLLMDEWLPNWEEICADLKCVSLHVNADILTLEHVKAVKKRGLVLLCYTVNEASRAATLFNWGVDAIFSDNIFVIQ